MHNFPIGRGILVWNHPIIHAPDVLKKSAALTNKELGESPGDVVDLIIAAADEAIVGKHDAESPLVVLQTDSGTQLNTNANKIIANLAIKKAGSELGSKTPVRPNNHVNCGQFSNDTLPTATRIVVVSELNQILFPAVGEPCDILKERSAIFMDAVEAGRTHLQGVIPITMGQETSSWATQLDFVLEGIHFADQQARGLAIDGTAADTGLNAHPEFGRLYAKKVSEETGSEFEQASNSFASLSAHDVLVQVSGSLRVLADALMKTASDVRWGVSGSRNGIGKLLIPESESGSSIMSGRVSPARCETMTMVCVKVLGNDITVGFAGPQSNFQLNVFKPAMTWCVLKSARLPSDTCRIFAEHCARDLEPNYQRVEADSNPNLVQVIALSRHIGYDEAAETTKNAHHQGISLRESALKSGFLTTEGFDKWVMPLDVTHPSAS